MLLLSMLLPTPLGAHRMFSGCQMSADFSLSIFGRRRSQPTDKLSGIQFSVLGLGDSNYTRFAHVPRVLKGRFLDLGAAPFYDCLDADEVDGLEDIVERWVGGLWAPLQRAMLGIGAADPKVCSNVVVLLLRMCMQKKRMCCLHLRVST